MEKIENNPSQYIDLVAFKSFMDFYANPYGTE